jgi:hypothetical protein
MSQMHIDRLKGMYAANPANSPKVVQYISEIIDANREYIDPDTDATITSAELDQAEARLRDAKAAKDAGTMELEAYKAVSAEVVRLRQVYRLQEHAAGRRHQTGAGLVGGDAYITGV